MKKITLLGALLISALSFGQATYTFTEKPTEMSRGINPPNIVPVKLVIDVAGIAGDDVFNASGLRIYRNQTDGVAITDATNLDAGVDLVIGYNYAWGNVNGTNTYDPATDNGFSYVTYKDPVGLLDVTNTGYDYENDPGKELPNVAYAPVTADLAVEEAFVWFGAGCATGWVCTTSNGGVVNVVEYVLSNDEFNELTSSVYPNPATDVVYFGSDVETESYKVMSVSGALVKEVAGSEKSIDVADLAPGLYLIVTDQGTARLIKQ